MLISHGGSQKGCSRWVAPAWHHNSRVLVMLAIVSVRLALFCRKVQSFLCCQMSPITRTIIVLTPFLCSALAPFTISVMMSTALLFCCQFDGCMEPQPCPWAVLAQIDDEKGHCQKRCCEVSRLLRHSWQKYSFGQSRLWRWSLHHSLFLSSSQTVNLSLDGAQTFHSRFFKFVLSIP